MGISFATSRVGERKIDLRVVFAIAILLAPAFRPRFVYQVGGEGALVASQIYLCIATVLACAYLVASSRKLPFSIWALVALVAIVFLSTAANGGDLRFWLDAWLPCILVVMVALSFRRIELLYSVFFVTVLLCIVNLVSMIIWPQGMLAPSVFFYGNRNAVYQIAFPCTLCAFCIDALRGRRFPVWSIFAVGLSLGQLVFGGSKTSTVAYALLLVFCIVVAKQKIGAAVSLLLPVGASFLGTLLVVIMRVQEHFGFLLQAVFGRRVDLSGRAPLWDVVFSLLDSSHIMYGRGVSGHDLLIVDGLHLYYTHNMYLELIFVSGVLGLVAFLLAVGLLLKRMKRSGKSLELSLSAATVGAYFIIGITESMFSSSFFLVFAIATVFCSSEWNVRMARFVRGRLVLAAEGAPKMRREGCEPGDMTFVENQNEFAGACGERLNLDTMTIASFTDCKE